MQEVTIQKYVKMILKKRGFEANPINLNLFKQETGMSLPNVISGDYRSALFVDWFEANLPSHEDDVVTEDQISEWSVISDMLPNSFTSDRRSKWTQA